MLKNVISCIAMIVMVLLLTSGDGGCDGSSQTQSSSGVTKATVKVPTGSDGLTTEQRNVGERLVMDNKVGSIKHLYVISAYSGQVIIYSTVRGKVTSSGKRLTPNALMGGERWNSGGFPIWIGDQEKWTTEVLQDDGTYGSSAEYLFWWDTKGIYHQHYVSGGQIIHISDQPLSVKGIIINMELTVADSPTSE